MLRPHTPALLVILLLLPAGAADVSSDQHFEGTGPFWYVIRIPPQVADGRIIARYDMGLPAASAGWVLDDAGRLMGQHGYVDRYGPVAADVRAGDVRQRVTLLETRAGTLEGSDYGCPSCTRGATWVLINGGDVANWTIDASFSGEPRATVTAGPAFFGSPRDFEGASVIGVDAMSVGVHAMEHASLSVDAAGPVFAFFGASTWHNPSETPPRSDLSADTPMGPRACPCLWPDLYREPYPSPAAPGAGGTYTFRANERTVGQSHGPMVVLARPDV